MSPAMTKQPQQHASGDAEAKKPQGVQKAAAAAPKGPVAILQEFVQCARHSLAPQHRAILQWTYDQRIASGSALEFRATVAFLLDGVPHHVTGAFQTSKKLAQRDVAERALHFYIGKWGEQLLDEECAQEQATSRARSRSDMQALESFCLTNSACDGHGPEWSHRATPEGLYAAEVRIMLLGVRHTFAGGTKASQAEASADVARRVLWYFQCPGYESLYAPDPRAPALAGKDIPAPPANWACSDVDVEELRKAERKVVLMRVQNRLQQELAKVLRPGQGVWEWSYEMDEKDTVWPPLYKATAVVPGLGKTFVGAWARGQREAQVETCLSISDFLDTGRSSEIPTSSGGSTPNSEEVEQRVRWADIEDEI